jgi:hypothetical protein
MNYALGAVAERQGLLELGFRDNLAIRYFARALCWTRYHDPVTEGGLLASESARSRPEKVLTFFLERRFARPSGEQNDCDT